MSDLSSRAKHCVESMLQDLLLTYVGFGFTDGSGTINASSVISPLGVTIERTGSGVFVVTFPFNLQTIANGWSWVAHDGELDGVVVEEPSDTQVRLTLESGTDPAAGSFITLLGLGPGSPAQSDGAAQGSGSEGLLGNRAHYPADATMRDCAFIPISGQFASGDLVLDTEVMGVRVAIKPGVGQFALDIGHHVPDTVLAAFVTSDEEDVFLVPQATGDTVVFQTGGAIAADPSDGVTLNGYIVASWTSER